MNTHPNQLRDTLPPDEVLLEPAGEFAADLRNLRSAVWHAAGRATAESVASNWLAPARRRRRAAQGRLVLALSTATTFAALLCIGVLPLLHHDKRVAPAPLVAIQSTSDDTALLEQVDTEVSASVPSSLAPLDNLDTWSSTDSANETSTNSSLSNPEKKNVAQ